PRQLLVHGTFVEEYRKLIPEIRIAIPERGRADAVLALVGLLIGKSVDWNSLQCTWDPTRDKIGHTFVQHAFPVRWTHTEFEGASELLPWAFDQTIDAYRSLAELLAPAESGG